MLTGSSASTDCVVSFVFCKQYHVMDSVAYWPGTTCRGQTCLRMKRGIELPKGECSRHLKISQ